ncbi:MAG: hypothetical protein ACOYNI_02395 [Acidimicrobiia bacterium]
MPTEPGPLLASDEFFNHQIVDTFGRVGQTDRAWTEKVCAMAAATDGSLQCAFGLGKYTNRNVMDAYAGVSRGTEQWTVRASRQLAPHPETLAVGPIRYEVVEPLRTIRFSLDANDVQPIAFEWTFTRVVPPSLESREVHVSRDRYRLDADVIRYHQSGVAEGWVEVDGERTEFSPTNWVSTRDHSWGVRYQVGAPLPDIAPVERPAGTSGYVLWFPVVCTAADGTKYALHFYYQRFAFGGWSRLSFEGAVEHADGRRDAIATCTPELRFDDAMRRFLGGSLHCTMTDGTARDFHLAPVSDTGFHLATGLYGGFDEQFHGQWRGPQHTSGEHIADCTAPDVVARVRQHRECVVRVEDPSAGGVGIGNLQSIIVGPHPEIGLTDNGVGQ